MLTTFIEVLIIILKLIWYPSVLLFYLLVQFKVSLLLHHSHSSFYLLIGVNCHYSISFSFLFILSLIFPQWILILLKKLFFFFFRSKTLIDFYEFFRDIFHLAKFIRNHIIFWSHNFRRWIGIGYALGSASVLRCHLVVGTDLTINLTIRLNQIVTTVIRKGNMFLFTFLFDLSCSSNGSPENVDDRQQPCWITKASTYEPEPGVYLWKVCYDVTLQKPMIVIGIHACLYMLSPSKRNCRKYNQIGRDQ